MSPKTYECIIVVKHNGSSVVDYSSKSVVSHNNRKDVSHNGPSDVNHSASSDSSHRGQITVIRKRPLEVTQNVLSAIIDSGPTVFTDKSRLLNVT